MMLSNKSIVERTWGLHQYALEAATPERAPLLSYGRNFRYDEFQKTGSVVSAFLLSFVNIVGGLALSLFAPVRCHVVSSCRRANKLTRRDG